MKNQRLMDEPPDRLLSSASQFAGRCEQIEIGAFNLKERAQIARQSPLRESGRLKSIIRLLWKEDDTEEDGEEYEGR